MEVGEGEDLVRLGSCPWCAIGTRRWRHVVPFLFAVPPKDDDDDGAYDQPPLRQIELSCYCRPRAINLRLWHGSKEILNHHALVSELNQ